MNERNKVVTAGARGITVYFTDTNRVRFYPYEYDMPLLPYLKQLNLFGDKYKGIDYHEHEAPFTSSQMRMYHDALHGLNSYSVKQLRSMTTAEKTEIATKHTASKKVLNKYKQQLLNKAVDELLTSLFFKSSLVKQWVKKGKGYTDKTMHMDISFRELGITEHQVASKLIEKGILPMNFYSMAKAA